MVGIRNSTAFNRSVLMSTTPGYVVFIPLMALISSIDLSVSVHVFSGFKYWGCVFKFRMIEDTVPMYLSSL